MTARLPEFDWFVNDRLNKVDESYRQSIRKFAQLSQYRYEIESLTKEDIEQFLEKYKYQGILKSNEGSREVAARILHKTSGLPIMVKFNIFGKGLKEDVEDRYYRYITDGSDTQQPDLGKIQTILVCSLLDIVNLPITDKLLEKMDLLRTAYALEHAILYQYSEGLWKTIHAKWDMELLSFLDCEKNKSILFKRKEHLKKALDLIFKIYDESTTAFIIQTMYDMASFKKIPINVVETSTNIPDYLSSKTNNNLYTLAIATTYRDLHKIHRNARQLQ